MSDTLCARKSSWARGLAALALCAVAGCKTSQPEPPKAEPTPAKAEAEAPKDRCVEAYAHMRALAIAGTVKAMAGEPQPTIDKSVAEISANFENEKMREQSLADCRKEPPDAVDCVLKSTDLRSAMGCSKGR